VNQKNRLILFLMIILLTLLTPAVSACQIRTTVPEASPSARVEAAVAGLDVLDQKPTATPSPKPTATPSLKPTATPSLKPTATPSLKPTATPSLKPTATPSLKPTATSSPKPTAMPSLKPTAKPSPKPTATPSPKPTAKPSPKTTATPSPKPTAKPSPKPTATPSAKPAEPGDISAEVWIREIIRLTNEIRVANGLKAFTAPSSALAKAAAIRGDEQAELYSHTRPDGSSCFTVLTECGVSCSAAGENIAMGTADAFTPEDIVNMWMNSDGHRKNILSPIYTSMGIGYGRDGPDEDKIYEYFVQLFICS